MSTTAFRRIAEQREAPPEKDPTRCAAYGCKCRSSVNLGGSGWACFAHAFAQSDQWPSITRGLESHDWLLGLVAEVRNLERNGKAWREFAMRFWEQSDRRCQPHPAESAGPYCDRMLLELLYRIGQRKSAPSPRIPKPVKPSGRFARESLNPMKEAA